MSKRQKRKDLLTLAEWSEDMARHTLVLALEADTKQRQRALRFRAKRHAQIATAIRQAMDDIQELTCGDPRKVCPNCKGTVGKSGEPK